MYFFSNGILSEGKVIAGYEPLEAPMAPKLLTNKHSHPPQCTGKTLLRAVKLTAFFILIACLQVSARTNAQRLSISLKNSPLDKVFSEIERQTNYVFFYDAVVLKGTRPVTLELHDVPVEDILKMSFKGQSLDFSIHDRTIFIKKEEPAKIIQVTPVVSDGANSISGLVRSEAGIPLVGATIVIKKLRKSGITDAKGEFLLKDVPNGEYKVEISYVGFETYTTIITVVDHEARVVADMKQVISNLDAPVVIPYGTTTKRLNTGDVTTVTSKEIAEQPVSNPLAALEGRVPGLFITQTTGVPGGGFTTLIRGKSSILNGTDPFYVIDGIPYPSKTQGLTNNSLNGGSPLNFINPSDIESIEVLKDADATSIYGSRAANGAILITTKKGKPGKTKIDINVYSGLGKAARDIKMLNTPQYLQMRREAFRNDSMANPTVNIHPTTSNAPDLLVWDTTRYTDWQKLLIGNAAHYDDAQASFSGGNVNNQYLIGAGYHRETGVFPVAIPGQGVDQKASVHFNLGSSSENKKFRLNLNGSYISDVNTLQTADFGPISFSLAPDAPGIHNPDGSLNWAPLSPGQTGTWSNPLAILNNPYKGVTSNLVSNAMIGYTLLKGLELKSSLGYTTTITNERLSSPTTSNDPGFHVTTGSSVFNSTGTKSWIIEPQAEYKVGFGKGVLSALGGLTFQANSTSNQSITATGYSNDALLGNLQSASGYRTSSSSADYKYNALFGRLNFNWQDKYLLNVSARRDGSSRFGPGRQFSNFGAVGAAWIFSEENFFKHNVSFLSFGKIRASYGTSGNDQIGDYRYLDLYTSTSNPYQGLQGLYPGNLFNSDLAWELDRKLEGGLELGFLRDRIGIQASYFRNRSGNQLVTTPVSAVTGFSTIPANLPALVQNSGFELILNFTNVRNKNFSWTTSFNLTIPRNKLISFPNLQNSGYKNLYVIGQPTTIAKVYHLTGVNDTTGAFQYATSKGVPTYSPTSNIDNTVLENTAPKLYGGIQNSLQYKGFNLSFLFQFVQQTGRNIYFNINSLPGMLANQPVQVFNRWQKPGDQKPYQRFSQTTGQAYTAFNYVLSSDLAYSDASFIRLKNLSFSYTIPVNWSQKCRIQALRVYLQGQNLLTITKYLGADPESQGNTLPPIKVLTTGFQVTF